MIIFKKHEFAKSKAIRSSGDGALLLYHISIAKYVVRLCPLSLVHGVFLCLSSLSQQEKNTSGGHFQYLLRDSKTQLLKNRPGYDSGQSEFCFGGKEAKRH